MDVLLLVSVSYVVLCQQLNLGSCLPTPAPPSLPLHFKMEAVCQSWLDKHPWNCALVSSSGDIGPGNLLLERCASKDIQSTKLYDFDNDTIHEYNGKTGQANAIKGTAESRMDMFFPVKSQRDDRHKISYNPDSLIRFDGKNKRLVQGSLEEACDWDVDASVTFQGETYDCVNHIIFTRSSLVSPYCSSKEQGRRHCPRVPLDSQVDCGNDKLIHCSFSDYEKDYDQSIFEHYLETRKAHDDNVEPISPSAPPPGLSTKGSLAGIVAVVILLSVAVLVIILRCWWARRANQQSPIHRSASDDGATTPLTDNCDLSESATSSTRHKCPEEINAAADNAEVISNSQLAFSNQADVSSSDAAPENPADRLSEECLECQEIVRECHCLTSTAKHVKSPQGYTHHTHNTMKGASF